jgi:MscS family membrane protein
MLREARRLLDRTRIRLAALCLALLGSSTALAQPAAPAPSSAPSASGAPAPEKHADPGSPRATVARFLKASRGGDFQQAANELELDASQKQRGAELAKRLKFVLDRYASLDLSRISADPSGELDDGLAPSSERIATIPDARGGEESVQLLLVAREPAVWLFSAATVLRIDAWYEKLGPRFIIEHIPLELQKAGPLELSYWQWLALPLAAAVAWLLGMALTRLTRAILGRLVQRTEAAWDDDVLARTRGPMRLAWATLAGFALLPWLGLHAPAEKSLHGALRAFFLLAIFWALVRSLTVAGDVISRSRWAVEHGASRSLVPLGIRAGKVAVVALAVVAMLSEFGYPVGGVVAGLGVGGLALALAAQKTGENLFGAFSIGLDQPFREGDFVKIEDFVGTVEAIGLRSTRIRTLDRTVITLPNGKLADMRIETFAPRDRIRLAVTIGVVYETTEAQMRKILEGFERVLREHPKIWQETVVVRFAGFGASSLDIEIMAWFETQDFDVFRDCRQDVLLGFMAVVHENGSSFAFPSRTLHLASVPEGLRAHEPPRAARGSGDRVEKA